MIVLPILELCKVFPDIKFGEHNYRGATSNCGLDENKKFNYTIRLDEFNERLKSLGYNFETGVDGKWNSEYMMFEDVVLIDGPPEQLVHFKLRFL